MAIDDDDRGARRERDKCMVGGLGVIECDTTAELRRDRVGTVMILMESMGPVAYTGRAWEGLRGCEATEWYKETLGRCLMTHGARGTRRVVMMAREQG